MFIQQYILTRIILQRHKSFLLPSNFSPRVVQRLRHPPILILLYAASDNSNVAASDNHPSVPAAASPTTVANDTQAAGETRDGDEVVEWDADEEEQEGDLDDG